MSEGKAIDVIAIMVILYSIYANFWKIVATILFPLLKLILIFASPFIVIYALYCWNKKLGKERIARESELGKQNNRY